MFDGYLCDVKTYFLTNQNRNYLYDNNLCE